MSIIYLDTEFLVDHVDGAITFRAGTRCHLPADYARALQGSSGGRAMIHGPADGTLAPTLPDAGADFYTTPFYTANQVHRAGTRVLVCWASTGARNQAAAGVDQTTYTRYADPNNGWGAIELDASPELTDWYVGKLAKITSAQNPDIIAFAQVLAITASIKTAGWFHLTLKELYTAPRRAIDVNQAPYKTDGTMSIHDMQMSAGSHSWMMKLGVRFRGSLDFWNLSSGGTQPTDWQNPDLRAYVQSLVAITGYFDIGLFNFGTGNAYTNPVYSAQQIAAQQADNLAFYSQFVREAVLVGEPGARLYGDSNLVTNGPTTPDFQTLMLNSHYDRKHTSQDHPTMVFVDPSYVANLPSRRGTVNTNDLVGGRTPADYTDGSGIHWTPAMNDRIAEQIAAPIIPRVQVLNPFALVQPDNAYDAPNGDIAGIKNSTAMVGWAGAVPVIAAVVNGLPTSGTFIQGMVGDGSGFDGTTMSGTAEVVEGEEAGRELRVHFFDPTVGGATLNVVSRGLTGRTFLSMMNDAQWRGRLMHMKWDIGLLGFNAHSVFTVDVSLWVTGPVVGTIRVASIYTNEGTNAMASTKRNYIRGFNGVHRALPFYIPTDTFTDAYLRFSVVGQTPLSESVSIAGDGTTATITCSVPFAAAFGAIGRQRIPCQVTGSSNAAFNQTGADGLTVFTQSAENQVQYPCTAAGAAPGGAAIHFAQSFPMGELLMRWGDFTLGADVVYPS